MAGKSKKRIEYAGWSVDIFDGDVKIDRLLDAHGWVGFAIYFYLCQKAFGTDGYYYLWGYSDSASTARRMGCGIGSGTIQEVVGYCLQIGLFDKGLFDRWGVLTSKGIQRTYWAVVSGRREKTVREELWLLQDNECIGLVKIAQNNHVQATNDHVSAANDHSQGTNAPVVYSSVVKGSVEYSNLSCPPEGGRECLDDSVNAPVEEAPTDEVKEETEKAIQERKNKAAEREKREKDFETIYRIYPKKVGRQKAFEYYLGYVGKGRRISGANYRLTNRQIYIAVMRYVQEQKESNTEIQFYKNFDTFMNKTVLDYID